MDPALTVLFVPLFLPDEKELTLYTIHVNNTQNQLSLIPNFYACYQICINSMLQYLCVSFH